MSSGKVKYEKLVIQAKGFIKNINENQMKVASYALAACTIKMGYKHSESYTLADFARDIGLPKRTLYDWVQQRKIQSCLDTNNVSIRNTTELRKIALALRAHKLPQSEQPLKYSDSKKVMKAYKTMQKMSNEDVEMERMIKHLKTINFKLSSYKISMLRKRQLNTIETLMMESLTHIVMKREA